MCMKSGPGLVGYSPNSVDTLTLGVLTVVIKHRCLITGVAWACAASSLLFAVHSCLSKSSKCISTAQACRIWWAGAGACRDCALVVVPCAFLDMVVIFRGRRRETSRSGGPKSTSRDRCKGSERLYFKLQTAADLWQAQHFGHGGDLRGALIS